LDKKQSVFGNRFSLVTAFIVADAVVALPALLLAAIASFYFGAASLGSLQFALLLSAVTLPAVLLILGAWKGLQFEQKNTRRALLWAAMPWPISIIYFLAISLIVDAI
jgi:hypothetical protein